MYEKIKIDELVLKNLDGFMNYVMEQNRNDGKEEYYYHHTKIENLQ